MKRFISHMQNKDRCFYCRWSDSGDCQEERLSKPNELCSEFELAFSRLNGIQKKALQTDLLKGVTDEK